MNLVFPALVVQGSLVCLVFQEKKVCPVYLVNLALKALQDPVDSLARKAIVVSLASTVFLGQEEIREIPDHPDLLDPLVLPDLLAVMVERVMMNSIVFMGK